MLYPLTFVPIIKERIWGGNKLSKILNKNVPENITAGESWEVSTVKDNESVVANGFLAGNNLQELVEVYMTDLVGEKVYEKYREQFPLLIKFIDAADVLSLQVHPNDELAKERHNSNGKTEMWYIIEAEPDAFIISGFNKDVSKEEYLHHLQNNTLETITTKVVTNANDVFYIPAGRIHAIGKGILLAEIQQTSDITYRIYDWNRVDKNGNPRELHTDLALDAIDFSSTKDPKTTYQSVVNKPTQLIHCPYFTTNLLHLTHPIEREYLLIDSFKILMCIHGEGFIEFQQQQYPFFQGTTYLIPAALELVNIIPNKECKLLEIYINE